MKTNNIKWIKSHFGYTALLNGTRLSISNYRYHLNGKSLLGYVPRINGNAPTSPALVYETLSDAKLAIEKFLLTSLK